VDRCHLYLPLVDSSGVTYRFAEVTLLDTETGTPIEEPVYLDPYGGAPQTWPVLIDPAVINFWTDTPMRVTVQALLPGGSTFTRTGVDITPAPPATVRTQHPLKIGPSDGLDGTAMLAVSPNGSAIWQVLDSLRTHRHEGDAPDSTVLGPTDLTDIYPNQTWLGKDIAGAQGEGATALGALGQTTADEATVLGRGTAGLRAVAIGGGANAPTSSVVIGAGANASQLEQVALGHNANAAPGPRGAVILGANTTASADSAVKASTGVSVTEGGNVVLGNGTLPDLSWLPDKYVAILGNAVAARFFAVRNDASLGGGASTVGFYGNPGTYVPLVNSSGVITSTPGRAALLSLLAALDQLGMIYLTDGAIDDEFVDWTKTNAHSANAVLETGDADGSKAGDVNRAKRNAAGSATVTYLQSAGLRDFRLRAFGWANAGTPDLKTELVADVSANGTTWTRVPLAFQTLTATTNSWYQTWAANNGRLPAGSKYLRLTLDVNAAIFTPQIGRVIVRAVDPASPTGFGNSSFGSGSFGGS
jgi:hypothetical protein